MRRRSTKPPGEASTVPRIGAPGLAGGNTFVSNDRTLDAHIGALTPADRNVEGVVEMMLDATRNYDETLTADRLFDWYAAQFPTGRSAMGKIIVGT